MSLRIVPYESGGWEVDIRLRLPNGSRHRERRVVSHSSKSAARRWAEDRERHLLQHGPEQAKKEVPTLEEFQERFLEGHARANRQKPSGIAAKERNLRVHLVPFLGKRRLDEIRNEDIQRLKSHLVLKAPKTVNNILSVLNVLLKKAAEWNVIDDMPCAVKLLKASSSERPFYNFEDYERFVDAAEKLDPRAHLLVLLSGDAGLRLGEMVALRWTDLDLGRRQVCVQRSTWKGEEGSTKGGRLRYVPLTSRLAGALRTARHLKGPFVLYQDDGQPMTEKVVQRFLRDAARSVGLSNNGPHMLRHTFCSHLAMRGAPAGAIQQLAGHKRLSTTEQYMHLSPAALTAAIQLLEPATGRGNSGEAPQVPIANALA